MKLFKPYIYAASVKDEPGTYFINCAFRLPAGFSLVRSLRRIQGGIELRYEVLATNGEHKVSTDWEDEVVVSGITAEMDIYVGVYDTSGQAAVLLQNEWSQQDQQQPASIDVFDFTPESPLTLPLPVDEAPVPRTVAGPQQAAGDPGNGVLGKGKASKGNGTEQVSIGLKRNRRKLRQRSKLQPQK
ncbi:MAG: hypothetical protein D6730_18585 [Bacteroidetes bacterium]|nr:MAG: hypothetical protein D6730_18585 [Bacteroidota bacterium]